MDKVQKLRKKILKDTLRDPRGIDNYQVWMESHPFTLEQITTAFGDFDSFSEIAKEQEISEMINDGVALLIKGEFQLGLNEADLDPNTPIGNYTLGQIRERFKSFQNYATEVNRTRKTGRRVNGGNNLFIGGIAGAILGGSLVFALYKGTETEYTSSGSLAPVALASARADSLRDYEDELRRYENDLVESTRRADSLSAEIRDLEGSLGTVPTRTDTVYRTVRVPGTRTPTKAELNAEYQRGAREAETATRVGTRNDLFSRLPEGPRLFDYIRLETPTEIIFRAIPRRLIPNEYDLAVAETQQLGEYLGELRIIRTLSPKNLSQIDIQKFELGNLEIYVAKDPFNGGIGDVRVVEVGGN